jgi:hypothetical protein
LAAVELAATEQLLRLAYQGQIRHLGLTPPLVAVRVGEQMADFLRVVLAAVLQTMRLVRREIRHLLHRHKVITAETATNQAQIVAAVAVVVRLKQVQTQLQAAQAMAVTERHRQSLVLL